MSKSEGFYVQEELLELCQQGIIDRGSRPAPTPPPPKLVGTLPESLARSPKTSRQRRLNQRRLQENRLTRCREGERGFVERSVLRRVLMASVFDFSDSVEDVQKKGRPPFLAIPMRTRSTSRSRLMKRGASQTGSTGALALAVSTRSLPSWNISPGQVAALNVNVARDNIRNRRGNYADIANILLTGMSPAA